MRTEALLATAAVAVLLVVVALAAFVPGFVAEPDSDEPPARFDVAETTLAAGEVTGETATLETTVFLRHQGGPADNVTVVVRATDAESGLVADTATHRYGTLEANGEREVPLSVTVPREGGYEITTILYVDGQRADVARASVNGVEALTPPYAESSVEFHRFADRPSVEYTIESAGDGAATLGVTGYLTNGGDDPESDLRLVVTARHADANVVADRAETTVGAVEAGRTATVETTVTVPDDHNYYLDATLWRDGVILDSTRTAANLDPTETIAAEETRQEVTFEAGDFETARADGPERPEAEPDAEEQSGFGAALAVVALLCAAFAARGWSR